MPFSLIGGGKYRSPSGHTFTEKQVRLWYAQGGKFPGQKGPGELTDAGGRAKFAKKNPALRIGRQAY